MGRTVICPETVICSQLSANTSIQCEVPFGKSLHLWTEAIMSPQKPGTYYFHYAFNTNNTGFCWYEPKNSDTTHVGMASSELLDAALHSGRRFVGWEKDKSAEYNGDYICDAPDNPQACPFQTK